MQQILGYRVSESMNLFHQFVRRRRKRKAIEFFVTRLGKRLAQKHGKEEFYSVLRVKNEIMAAGLPLDDLCYAIVIHCTKEDFDAWVYEHDAPVRYWQLRLEIADYNFQSNNPTSSWDSGGDNEYTSLGPYE